MLKKIRMDTGKTGSTCVKQENENEEQLIEGKQTNKK